VKLNKKNIVKKIELSKLLSPDRKKRILHSLPNLSDEQIKKLEKALKQEAVFLKKMLKKNLKKILSEGDKVSLALFKQTLNDLTRKASKKEEEASIGKEAETLTDIEKQINNL